MRTNGQHKSCSTQLGEIYYKVVSAHWCDLTNLFPVCNGLKKVAHFDFYVFLCLGVKINNLEKVSFLQQFYRNL